MPKLFSSKHIVKVLVSRDFVFVSQRGSHIKYRKRSKGKTFTVIVPAERKEIPFGTFHSILRQSGLSKEDFNGYG